MSQPPPPSGPNVPQGGYSHDPYRTGPHPAHSPYAPPPYASEPRHYAGPPAPRSGVADRLGIRALRRPEPRFGTSLAAAGVFVAVIGILVWAGGHLGSGIQVDFNESGPVTQGGGRRFLGAGLFLVLVLLGYGLLVVRRTGPLATAGAVAGAVGVPLAIGFVTFDIGNTFSGDLPINLDALALVSILVWLASYFAVPGARGRSFYLGATAVMLASYVGFKSAGDSTLQSAVNLGGSGAAGSPDTNAVGAIGLVFGLAYYAIAALLDRRGQRGAAVALAFAGFVVTLAGVAGLAESFGVSGTGVLLIALGVLLAWYGGRFGRRFTTWLWSTAVLVGIVMIIAKASPDNFTAAGISLIVIGVVVVVLAYLASAATNEAPDIVEERAAAPTG